MRTMNLAMAQRVRADGVAIAATLIGLASMAWLGLVGFAWTDYDFEVAPAYKALAAGHPLALSAPPGLREAAGRLIAGLPRYGA